MGQVIRVYGTRWCGDCHRSRRLLDKHHVPYAWIDIEKDAEAQRMVKEINGGYMSVPTIIFEDGTVLAEPSDGVLAEKAGI
ncbi:MAG: NrdH-redoxin [Chloroflexi bacterium]|nr:NrdH-redoxin [Chloroflexota bacterium]